MQQNGIPSKKGTIENLTFFVRMQNNGFLLEILVAKSETAIRKMKCSK
jgi:hypothetical protein